MTRPLRVLVLGCLAFWAAATGLIYLYWDRLGLPDTAVGVSRDQAMLIHGVALGLCLVPMTATLLWIGWAGDRTPDQQLVAILGSTGVRMFFVLGAGLILANTVPDFVQHPMTFWLWVLVVYLVTLGLEIVVLVRARDALEAQRKPTADGSSSAPSL